MHKAINYLLIFILLSSLAFAVDSQVTSFTGQTNPFNITFTGNQNQSFILPIPSYGYVKNISFNLQTYRIDNSIVYIENLTQYEFLGSWNYQYNLTDSDYSTRAWRTLGTAEMFINYTKTPYDNNVTWQIKWGLNGDSYNETFNITIPQVCFNAFTDKYGFYLQSNSAPFNSVYFCLNGTNPQTDRLLLVDKGAQSGYIFEEAIFVNRNSSPEKVAIYLNGINQTASNSSMNITLANNILSTNQPLNFTFHSDTAGILQVNLTNASYSYGIDNCSNSFNIPSNSTFNILTYNEKTANSIFTNGSFNIYYSGIDITDPENIYAVSIENKSNYQFCKYPSWSNLGGIIVSSLSSPSYQQENFNRYGTYFNQNYSAYLLPIETTSNYITYIIQDSGTSTKKIQNAVMRCYRIIGGIPTEVQEGLSDVAGQILFYQDQLYRYDCTVNATGYPLKTFSLQPTLTTYTVSMNEQQQSIVYTTYQGLRYKVIPSDTMFNISNDYQNITFSLDGSNLDYFGMDIKGLSNCSPSCRQIFYSINGGNITTSIVVNDTIRFYVNLFFKLNGKEEVTINSYPYDGVQIIEATNSAKQLLADIRNNTSPNVRTVLAAGVQTLAVILANSFGVVGVGILWVVLITTIGLSLPQVALIPSFYGLFSSIILIVLIIYYSRYG